MCPPPSAHERVAVVTSCPAAAAASKPSGCPFSSLMSSSTSQGGCPWQQQQQQLEQLRPLPLAAGQGATTANHSPASSCDSGSDSDCDTTSSSSISSSSTSSSGHMHQAWKLKRPTLNHDPKLTRRQLRQLGRTWSLADVAQHRYCDDGWIAVDGRVYDITEHIASHPGWDSGCRVTEVLSIIAHLGIECSSEFHEIHRVYPVAYKQLAAYYIGDLSQA